MLDRSHDTLTEEDTKYTSCVKLQINIKFTLERPRHEIRTNDFQFRPAKEVRQASDIAINTKLEGVKMDGDLASKIAKQAVKLYAGVQHHAVFRTPASTAPHLQSTQTLGEAETPRSDLQMVLMHDSHLCDHEMENQDVPTAQLSTDKHEMDTPSTTTLISLQQSHGGPAGILPALTSTSTSSQALVLQNQQTLATPSRAIQEASGSRSTPTLSSPRNLALVVFDENKSPAMTMSGAQERVVRDALVQTMVATVREIRADLENRGKMKGLVSSLKTALVSTRSGNAAEDISQQIAFLVARLVEAVDDQLDGNLIAQLKALLDVLIRTSADVQVNWK